MEHVKNYNTKQKEYILSFLKANKDTYLTADEILQGLIKNNELVSRATLYRYLDQLVENNIVRKILFQNETKATYQYVNLSEDKFVLKCNTCGKVLNTECEDLKKVCKHLYEDHNFLINEKQITLYGECEECQNAVGNIYEKN